MYHFELVAYKSGNTDIIARGCSKKDVSQRAFARAKSANETPSNVTSIRLISLDFDRLTVKVDVLYQTAERPTEHCSIWFSDEKDVSIFSHQQYNDACNYAKHIVEDILTGRNDKQIKAVYLMTLYNDSGEMHRRYPT